MFWTEGDREAMKLRERIRIQLIWALEGQISEFWSLELSGGEGRKE